MKILFYSDVHIRDHGSFSSWNTITKSGLTKELENIIKGFDFIKDTILVTSPDMVFCLGDIYHTTEQISNRSLHGSHECFWRVSQACKEVGADHFLMMGNHDCLSENPVITSISNLIGYCNNIFTDYTHIVKNKFTIAIIPYSSNNGKLYSNLIEAQNNSDLILTHLDFAGCMYESGIYSDSPISPDLIKPCISGDIHVAQSIGSVTYPGSLIQHRFSRDDLDKIGGIVIYDTDTNKVQRVPNMYSKHYVRVRDIQKGLSLPPDKVILQVISNKSKEEISELFKNYEFQYIPEVTPREDVISSYSSFSHIDPEASLRNFISENRFDSLGDFDEIIGVQTK